MRAISLYLIILITCSASIFGKDKELRFHYLSTENGLPRNTAFSIVEDKYGFIWLATLDGLCRFDGYKVKIYSGNPNNPNAPINNRPLLLIKDSKGDIWVSFSSHNLVCRYNYLTDDFLRVSRDALSPGFRSLFDRNTKSNWKAENNEYRWDINTTFLVQTNKKTRQQITYRYSQKKGYGLKDEMVIGLYLNSQNILWAATDVGGVSYADVNQPDFKYLLYIDNVSKPISETAIRAICQYSDGDLWIGTRKSGIAKISRSSNQLTYFKHSEKNPNSVSDNRIRKLYEDKYGLLWIGTKGGLDCLNPKSNRFKHYPAINILHSENWIYAIEEDNQNNLWIGTWTGVARYDREKDKFIPYKLSNPWYTYQIRTLLKEGKSSLWIGTENNGLTLFSRILIKGKEKVVCSHFINKPGINNSLLDNRVYCLCKDKFGFLWIGTGRGLNRFDPRTGKFISFPEKRFISNGMILGILRDNNYLFVSHLHGLTRIDCRTFKTSDFTTRDDLFNNEFSEDAYFRNPKTGECFWGGNLGIISFYPNTIEANPYPPRVVVTDFRISNKSISPNKPFDGHVILQRPAYLTNSVVLNWAERNIAIEFAALHYANPLNNTYAYRLSGFDKEWKNTDASNRVASYTNLPSGKYLFEVKAASSDGVWVKRATTLEIIILPPWWRTWWAYLIYTIGVAGLIYLAFKILITREKLNHQIQLERLKKEKAIELEELKSKFFTNISHELRTPLTLIIDPVKKLLEDKGPVPQNMNYFLQLIFDNSKRMLSLVNQLLDLKKVESKEMKLNISYVDIVSKVRSLVGMFEFQSRERGIRLNFHSTDDRIMTGVDVDKLDKVIINLLSNAFKFTPDKGTIDVEIKYSEDKSSFEIAVKDSGVGIPSEKIQWIFDPFYQVDRKDQNNGTGIGLSLVKDFVELHHGSIQVESVIGQGTCFQLTFPVENKGELQIDAEDQSNSLPLTSDVHSARHGIETTQQEDSNIDLPIVLIVEDNVEVREYLQMVLINNFRVYTAANGLEGFNKAIETMPDLVLSDIMMPVMSGVELCERLKTDQKTSHIPIVLLTARQSEDLIIASYETGADDYIPKPFNTTTLIARIKNLIESRQKLRLLFDKSTGYNLNVIASNQVDKQFLDVLVKKIYENMSRVTFDVEELASMMNMSRVQLNRKIKSMTDKTAQEFVLTIRLNKAAEYLLSGLYNVTEVSEMVGYSEPTNFTRSFARQFGETPKNYVASHRNVF